MQFAIRSKRVQMERSKIGIKNIKCEQRKKITGTRSGNLAMISADSLTLSSAIITGKTESWWKTNCKGKLEEAITESVLVLERSDLSHLTETLILVSVDE